MSKGSRDRTANFDSYRNSAFWGNKDDSTLLKDLLVFSNHATVTYIHPISGDEVTEDIPIDKLVHQNNAIKIRTETHGSSECEIDFSNLTIEAPDGVEYKKDDA